MFEVKLKIGDEETDKRQIEHPAEQADRLTAQAREFLRQALAKADIPAPEDEVQPSLRTAFTRVTLAPAHGRERATCDFDLSLSRPDGGSTRLREEFAVVETKSEHGDGPADRALHEMGIETVSLSKYRTGITLLHPGAEDPDGPPESARFFELD